MSPQRTNSPIWRNYFLNQNQEQKTTIATTDIFVHTCIFSMIRRVATHWLLNRCPFILSNHPTPFEVRIHIDCRFQHEFWLNSSDVKMMILYVCHKLVYFLFNKLQCFTCFSTVYEILAILSYLWDGPVRNWPKTADPMEIDMWSHVKLS